MWLLIKVKYVQIYKCNVIFAFTFGMTRVFSLIVVCSKPTSFITLNAASSTSASSTDSTVLALDKVTVNDGTNDATAMEICEVEYSAAVKPKKIRRGRKPRKTESKNWI